MKFTPVTTDSEGKYTLTGIPTNTEAYPVVEKPGYTLDAEYRVDDITKVVLVRAGSLKGRLVDKSGKPVKGVVLQLTASDWQVNSYKSLTTDGQGCYAAKDIYPTTYSINIGQKAGLTAKALSDVVVKVGETAKVEDMVAVPGAFVSGQVVDIVTGKPIAGGEIRVLGPMTGGSNAQLFYDVDKQGRFKFRSYPGKVNVLYTAREGLYRFDYPSKEMDVPQAGVSGVVLKARPADIAAGRVVDENGKPVSGAKLNVDGEYGTQITTDAAGCFTAMVAPQRNPGRRENEAPKVVLEVIDTEGRQGAYVRMGREELLKSKNLTITLRPARQLTLTVKDPQGKPLSGADAQMTVSFSETVQFNDAITTDENGQAVFDVYENGEYRPNAKLDGYYYVTRMQAAPLVGSSEWTDKAEITMQPATRVQKGKVVDEAGKPAAGATVRVSSPQKEARTDANGLFVLEGLPDAQVGLDVQMGDKYGSAVVSKDSGDATITLKKY